MGPYSRQSSAFMRSPSRPISYDPVPVGAPARRSPSRRRSVMPKLEIRDLQELRGQIGREVAVSDWLTVSQERINLFAEATEDRQWIHVDPARAAAESPFGTVAHGFLT